MRGAFDSRRDNLFLERQERGEQCSGFYPTCTRMHYSRTALNCTVCHKKRMTISWKRKELHIRDLLVSERPNFQCRFRWKRIFGFWMYKFLDSQQRRHASSLRTAIQGPSALPFGVSALPFWRYFGN